MTNAEPTELTILLKIVEVIDRRMSGESRAEDVATSVINTYIATTPSVLISASTEPPKMGDSYMTGHAVAVGPNSSAHDISFSQVWMQVESRIDLPALALELEGLRSEMRKCAKGDLQQDMSLAEAAQAQAAATSGDGPAVMEHLKKAGAWALEVAKSIGAELAVTAIKSAIGI